MLTVRGISYLVGNTPEAEVRRDLQTIARDLHCTTVMLIASDSTQLVEAARIALETGLGVYLRRHVPDLPQPEMLQHLDTLQRYEHEHTAGKVTAGSKSAPDIAASPILRNKSR